VIAPDPDPVAVSRLRSRLAVHAAGLDRRTTRRSVQLAWGIGIAAILLAIILLISAPRVVTAMRRLFGYIPGVGLVEQSATIRTLSAPVRVDQAGVVLEIEQVVADSEQTIVIYRWIESVPQAGSRTALQPGPAGNPIMRLPDGSTVAVRLGRRLQSVGDSFRYELIFDPLPPDVYAATLELSQLAGRKASTVEAGWKIPLSLQLAPAGMVLPVIEVASPAVTAGTFPLPTAPVDPGASGAAPTTPATPVAASNHKIGVKLQTVVPLEDGYLLTGSLEWSDQDYPANGVGAMPDLFSVTDSSGQPVPFEPVYSAENPPSEAYRSFWTIRLLTKSFQAPLEIRLNYLSVSTHPAYFTVDLGPQPVIDQTWELNRDIQVVDSVARILTARLITLGPSDWSLLFEMQVDPDVLSEVRLFLPSGQCGGEGGGAMPEDGRTVIQSYANSCTSVLPTEPVEVLILGALLRGSWQVSWTP
jgi:hypothetical protein